LGIADPIFPKLKFRNDLLLLFDVSPSPPDNDEEHDDRERSCHDSNQRYVVHFSDPSKLGFDFHGARLGSPRLRSSL
jgi:hypothetical protein